MMTKLSSQWPSFSESLGYLLFRCCHHDDVIKWKHFPHYWPFVRGIHWSLVNSLHKGQLSGALMFSLKCARINGWVNSGEAGDLRHHHAHYDITLMTIKLMNIRVSSCPSLVHICQHIPRFLTKLNKYFVSFDISTIHTEIWFPIPENIW